MPSVGSMVEGAGKGRSWLTTHSVMLGTNLPSFPWKLVLVEEKLFYFTLQLLRLIQTLAAAKIEFYLYFIQDYFVLHFVFICHVLGTLIYKNI